MSGLQKFQLDRSPTDTTDLHIKCCCKIIKEISLRNSTEHVLLPLFNISCTIHCQHPSCTFQQQRHIIVPTQISQQNTYRTCTSVLMLYTHIHSVFALGTKTSKKLKVTLQHIILNSNCIHFFTSNLITTEFHSKLTMQ